MSKKKYLYNIITHVAGIEKISYDDTRGLVNIKIKYIKNDYVENKEDILEINKFLTCEDLYKLQNDVCIKIDVMINQLWNICCIEIEDNEAKKTYENYLSVINDYYEILNKCNETLEEIKQLETEE